MGSALVGAVSELYQGDLDIGRQAAERLAADDLGQDVLAEDFHYGAIAVVQRLEEVAPDTLVLVGAASRGREPGTVQRRRIPQRALSTHDVQAAVSDAVTGYVGIDLILDIAVGFGAAPSRIVTIELEPVATTGASLSPEAAAALPHMLDLVRAEVRRAPLLHVGAQIRNRMAEGRLADAPAVTAMRDLLRELDHLDVHADWRATFAKREQVQARIAAGDTPEGMEHLDWALWWALLESIERLLPIDGVAGG